MGLYTNPFTAPGRWFRGNLHAHTTGSDGRLSPIEAAAWYRDRGYDFIAITDHDHRTTTDDLSSPGFLVLPGIEVHPDQTDLGQRFHLVGIGLNRSHDFGPDHAVQDAVDALRADDAIVILAHPYWSGLTLADMARVNGVSGLEVFNRTCDLMGAGTSDVHWDALLARGRCLWGLASDDAHWHRDDHGHGWIMLKAPELTPAAVKQALSSGSFYASRGPEIYDVQVTRREVYVRCSPVRAIACVSMPETGICLESPAPGRLLTEGTFPITHQRVYVRIICHDAQGLAAWTQPILL